MVTVARRWTHAAGPRAATAVALSASLAFGGGSTASAGVRQDVAPQVVVTVDGLACPFCVDGLEKHLRKLPGVTKVETDLREGQTTLDLAADADVTEENIRKAVRDAGFTASKIEWKAGEHR